MASLIAAAICLLIATRRGWPVSTTHSIIGAIVGASVTLGVMGDDAEGALALVHWDQIGTIVLSWIVSPLPGGIVAYLLFWNIQEHILRYDEQAQERLDEIADEREKFGRYSVPCQKYLVESYRVDR